MLYWKKSRQLELYEYNQLQVNLLELKYRSNLLSSIPNRVNSHELECRTFAIYQEVPPEK